MTDFDHIAFGKEMGAFLQDELRPLRAEVERLKGVEPPIAPEPVDIAALADEVVSRLLDDERLTTLVDLAATSAVVAYMQENPVRDGKDGKSVELDVVREMIIAEVAKIPAPRDGKDAEPVKPDEIAQAVAKHLEANPPKPGADGVGLAGAIIDRAGSLKVTTTKGEVIDLGLVQGRDGADFTECAIDYDGERTIKIKGRGGEITKSVPVPLDRGYWREGMGVEKSDILTHDGNAWIALRDTKSKPCHENKEDWRLFARRGRDGQDGKKVFVERQPVSLGE